MSNTIGFGQAAVNNTIDYGQGAIDNTINWGKSQTLSPSGETNITGTGGTPPFSNTQSIELDGISDYVGLGNDVSRQVQTLTMSVWVKPTANARDGIVLNGHTSYGNQGIEIYWNYNQFRARINGSTYGLGLGNGQNNWSHILVAYDGNTLKRMTNGVLLADVVVGATINYTNYNGFFLGRSPYGFHIGNIDEFAFCIWNRRP
jgi:hypothetical protein